jgi:hypothetical protein|tara:strand:- start:4469 stop:4681 length:213 start_codon:yes stop_codon:yes gene_type:complete
MSDNSHNFTRDTTSKALINTNKTAFAVYKETRNKRNKNLNEVKLLREEVDDLKILVNNLNNKIIKLIGEE